MGADAMTVNVRSDSNVRSVAKVIATLLMQPGDSVRICAVGAGAVNQAVKATAFAVHIVMNARGLSLTVTPIAEDGQDRRNGRSFSRIVLVAEVN